MSAYIKLETLEYPRHEGDIRLEHPDIPKEQTGATFACPSTYAKVHETNQPPFDELIQKCFEVAPIFRNGVWLQQWAIRNLTDLEIEAIQKNNVMYRAPQNLNVQGSIPNVVG